MPNGEEDRRHQQPPMMFISKSEQQQKLANSSAEKVDVGKVILEEQNRTKDLLVQLLQPTGVENMLKNLEAKVIEQDIHWRTVVQAKDKELTLLKSAGAVGQ
uniref:Uncharacterized protein n=1 Tax=Anopheles melas TaxID=34690 RepID=A0A182TQA5_9DIPT